MALCFKIYIICGIFFVSCTTGVSQYGNIVPSDTVEFQLQAEVYDDSFFSTVQIQGDTIINSEVYKRTYFKSFEYPFVLVGFFREDSTQGKAWFRNAGENEVLIFDLSLKVGDQFAIQFEVGCDWPQDTIATVTDVVVENEQKVITFDIKFGGGAFCESLRFIEGVGPNASLFFQSPIINAEEAGFYYLVCQKSLNGAETYVNSSNALCKSTRINTIPFNNLHVHYRVDGDSFIVESDLPSFQDWDVAVYDIMGRIIAINKSRDANIKVIEISNLQPSIYILVLLDNGRIVHTSRLFKG